MHDGGGRVVGRGGEGGDGGETITSKTTMHAMGTPSDEDGTARQGKALARYWETT